MANLIVACSVTRAELSLSDLNLSNPGVYKVTPDTGPGALSWRRETAQSAYVHGETLVGAVKDVQRSILGVRVFGSSAAVLDSRIASLLRAFEQFSYTLTLTIDGITHKWACQPSDYAIGDGGTLDRFGLMSFRQEIKFDIPRSPIPVEGGF